MDSDTPMLELDPQEQPVSTGPSTASEAVQEDYFGFEIVHTVPLPDGKSWVQHKEFTEGQRRKYLNEVNRDVVIQRGTGDARMRMAPGDERYSLLSTAIIGWNLIRGGQPVPFTDRNLKEFLEKANPRIIDLIEKEVRKVNPWLMQEMTSEDIRKEIANLEEMLEAKEKEEAKDTSFQG
jgi:hypothetical protein